MTDTPLNNWLDQSFPAPSGMRFSGLVGLGLISGLTIAMACGAASAAVPDAIQPLSCAVVDANTVTCTSAGVTTKCSGDVTIDSLGHVLCPPACDSLTAAPASIAAGASSTLSANCGGAITYAWTGSGCEFVNNTKSCTVTPSVTTSYTVKGINPSGTSFAAARATVTVQSQPAPVCTLASSPSFVLGSYTLTANCPGAATYIWSANTSCGSVATSPFCTVTPSSSNTTYSVQGVNSTNTVAGVPASVVVTATASTPQPSPQPPPTATTAPVCTLEAPAAFVLGSFNLTANCTPAAATYNWSANAPCGTGATSPFCAVSPSSTTTYSVTGVNAAGVGNTPSVTVSVTPPTAPTCTLTANPSAIVAGNSTALTATCTPAASSYNWTAATGLAPGTSTATLTTSLTTTPGIYTYTVAGVNAVGSSSPTQTTVTVTAPPRGCTLTATPLLLGKNESATLSAACAPAAASYAWTGGTCAGTTGATCQVTPDSTITYTVTGSDGTGSIGQATATVTVAPPACTLTATPASVAPGGAFTLTASCTPNPSSYAWSANAGLGSVAGGSVTAPSIAGSTAYTVTGSNGSGPGNTASATVQVTSAPVAYCGTDANKLDSGILSNQAYLNPQPGLNYQTRLDRGQSASFQFTTGSVAGGTGSIVLEMGSLGDMVQKYAQISTSPCDFKNYASIDNVPWDGCGTSDGVVIVRYVLENPGSPQHIEGSCSLQTNKTYYLNVRNEAALYPSQRNKDTCLAGVACALVFQIH